MKYVCNCRLFDLEANDFDYSFGGLTRSSSYYTNLSNYNELRSADFKTVHNAINTEMFLTPCEVFSWTCPAIYSSTTFVSY